jgi:hypothetical protein
MGWPWVEVWSATALEKGLVLPSGTAAVLPLVTPPLLQMLLFR